MIKISQAIPITTDASGDATAFSNPIEGTVREIRYAFTDFAATADFTITDNDTATSLWTESNIAQVSTIRRPIVQAHDTNGVAVTGVYTEPVVTGTVKIVIAQGGAAKTGTFRVVYEAH